MDGARVRFVLVSEGSSERDLVPHLQDLCVRAGAGEAYGFWPDLGRLQKPPGRTVLAKVEAALRLEPGSNLVFVHRDADGPDAGEVIEQIDAAVLTAAGCPPHVPVVPVQELEAWLLVDQEAIRRVVGKPMGKVRLGLPAVNRIEVLASPKEVLDQALLSASAKSGRHLERVKRELPRLRTLLLQQLDIEGPVASLPAWQLMVMRINAAVEKLGSGEDPL